MQRRKDSKNRVLKEGEYQRANGTYEFKWRDNLGKRHSAYAKTLEDLRDKEKEVTKKILDGIQIENKNITLNDLYYRWLELKRGLKNNTLQNYKYMYEQFVEPDFGNIKIDRLKRTDVRAFYNRLYDERHIKVSTIDSLHTVLHQVLELAVEDDYLRYNPSDNALKELKKAHNMDSTKRKSLTLKEQELFENYLINHEQRWYPIFYIMLWTGLRAGELTGLRWCDIDLENGLIDINHTLVYYPKGKGLGCGFSVNTPKTLSGRRKVPMTEKVKSAFLMEKKYQEENNIKCTSVIDNYSDFIFVNRFGMLQHYGTLNKALKRIIRDCNYYILESNQKNTNLCLLPKFSNHSLRHTFTTRMCEAGVNVKVMQEILGHADIEVTMNIYAEATKEFTVEEMINLESYFDSKMVK